MKRLPLLFLLPPLQAGGDVFGVSRTIDHAVYTALNAVAAVLWRLDTTLIAMSLYSYSTQDWLTGQAGGGVWQVLELISGPAGFLGERVWLVLLALALVLYGMSLLLRPFLFFRPVDLGKLLIFAVLSYAVIQQGSGLMVQIEQWRSGLGDYMYQGMAQSGSANINLPGVTASDEPLYPPADLDGRPPIRGWEAVSSSYFLVTDEAQLSRPIPPDDFRRAYCLYDPARPINEQAAENAQGCSPRKAWDEWDYLGSSGVITQVWGINLPVSLGYQLPIRNDHPENRELAIRQAQGGVARLALGPIVALYPLLEANISLMLALSAAVLYLTVPIVLLFGFFLYTQPMVNRLLLRFVTLIINTIILNGLIALFLLLLVNVSVNGSLSAYLGLVGVAVLGGFILSRVAVGTLKETLSAAMGAVGGAWMGATSAAMGREAVPVARGTLGAAKLLGAGAMMGAGAMALGRGGSPLDMWDASGHTAKSGLRDLDATGLEASAGVQKQAGRLPAPLARLARQELDTREAASADPMAGAPASNRIPPRTAGSDSWLPFAASAAATLPFTRNGSSATPQQPPAKPAAPRAVRQVVQTVQQEARYRAPDGTLNEAGLQAAAEKLEARGIDTFQSETGRRELKKLIAAQQTDAQPRNVPEAQHIDRAAAGPGRVQPPARDLFGEQPGREIEPVVTRQGAERSRQAVAAVRRAAMQLPPQELVQNGRISPAGMAAIQAELPPESAAAFRSGQGRRDLELPAAAALPAVQLAPQAGAQQTVTETPPLTVTQLEAGATTPQEPAVRDLSDAPVRQASQTPPVIEQQSDAPTHPPSQTPPPVIEQQSAAPTRPPSQTPPVILDAATPPPPARRSEIAAELRRTPPAVEALAGKPAAPNAAERTVAGDRTPLPEPPKLAGREQQTPPPEAAADTTAAPLPAAVSRPEAESGSEARQIAAALREQAKQDVIAGTETPAPTGQQTPPSKPAGEPTAAPLPAAVSRPEAESGSEARQIAAALREQAKQDVPAEETKKATGRELKAAALAAAPGAAPAHLKPDTAPSSGGSGVVAALRRGRLDDETPETSTAERKKRQPKKRGKKSTKPGTGERKTAEVETTPQPQVTSLLPHDRPEPADEKSAGGGKQ